MAMKDILYLLPCVVLFCAAYHGPDLPRGPYCGITGQCCVHRQDACSHQILDTLCYCDEHCNRTHDDCCPDYEEVCLGIVLATPPPPPPEPILLGNCVRGQVKMEKCNKCSCVLSNEGVPDWECERDKCITDDAIIERVNYGSYGWQAANYSEFYGKKLNDGLVYKLGTLPLSRETERMNPIIYDKDPGLTNFDARARWPQFISPVVDQGWCGSDWAVVVAGVTSDRLAIQSNGAEVITLSPQTILSCNNRGQQGCDGGHIDVAWNFVRFHGLVDETCFPYKASVTHCPFKRRGDLKADGCMPVVQKRTSRYKVSPPARLKGVKDIMYEIVEFGPVHAIMSVHQDFFHYKSGVYRHSQLGDIQSRLHSVRIVGWGEERGEDYWIVANSWGRQWGEDGYFRIARGHNESGIESFVVVVFSEVTEA